MNTKFFTKAIVLKTQSLREADLIVTLLTQQRGKLSAIARGARRSKKRFMGGVDLFDCGKLELNPTKRDPHFFSLNNIEAREVWLNLRGNLTKFSLASYCLELVNAFVPEGDEEGKYFYRPLADCFRSLNDAQADTSCYLPVVFFNLTLLNKSGFSPLADKLSLNTEIRNWWETMAAKEIHSNPEADKMISESFVFLSRYSQNIVGRKLHAVEVYR